MKGSEFLSENFKKTSIFFVMQDTRVFAKSSGTDGVGPGEFEILRNTIYSFSKAAVMECHKLGGLKQ